MNEKLFLSYYIRLFLTDFLAYERGLSENTILAYRDCLKLFLYYCDNELAIDIDKITCDIINDHKVTDFLNWLENKRNCSVKTRNARLAALKSFFHYLGRTVPECLDNTRKILLIPFKKTPHKTVDFLEEGELKAIIDGIDIESQNGYRDKALLLLMYNTGARVQEIVDLTIDDLRLDAAAQVKLTCKGKKQRICPLWEETIEAIKLYLDIRNTNGNTEIRLFLNSRCVPITRFGIRYIIRKYTKKASAAVKTLHQKNVSPHTIRHTTAMHLLQAGNELNMIRLWLGHASLNTTHMYIEIDMKMKKEILNKSHPPVLKEKKKIWKQPKILEWLNAYSQNSNKKLCEVTNLL
jgi:site-specific recombinase XerD